MGTDTDTTPAPNVIDLPHAGQSRDPNAKRAESRGVYEDRTGARRIVGAGDVIPDGWTLVEDSPIAERAERTPTAQEGATTREEGAARKRSSSRRGSRSGSDDS